MTDILEKWKNEFGDNIENDCVAESDEEQEEEKPLQKQNNRHIPLIEPIKEKREFATPAEFDAFYQEHREELNEKTTHKLNKMFNIPGYRITKLKGVLSLKNIPQSRITSTMKIDTLEIKVNEMKDRLNQCIKIVNGFIDQLNQNQNLTY